MAEPKSSKIRVRVLLVLTNVISIGLLIWALRDAKLGELQEDLASMDWWWVGLAVLTGVAVFLLQAVRWRFILQPVVRLGYWETVRAIFVGLYANEVLPLRAGEILRCYLLSRNEELPLSVALTSALIERVFDGIWLSISLFVMLHRMKLPRGFGWLVDSGYVLLIFVVAVGAILSLAMFRRHQTHAALAGSGKLQRTFRVLMDDLEIIGHSRYLLFAFLISLPILLLGAVPTAAAFRGYGFDLSVGTAVALTLILRLGSVVPQAPGNLGLFQFLARESLQKIFHVVPAEAARFSLVLWGILTLPMLVGGLISLFVADVKLGELHKAANSDSAELPAPREQPSQH